MARTRREAVALPTIVRELQVASVLDVTATTRRLTLMGEQLEPFAVAGGTAAGFRSDGFDDHVKLLVPIEGQERPPLPVQGPDRLEWGAAGGRPVAKDYTPRRYAPAQDGRAAELDLDLVLHDGGFAAGWARRAVVGDPAWIVGPTRSLLLPTGVDRLLVAGDETALPAIGRLLDEAQVEVPVDVIVEVASPDGIQDLAAPAEGTITWVHGASAWIQAVRDTSPIDGTTFCWVAGESGAVREVRRFLTAERGVPRDCLDATGYWRRSDQAERPS